MIKLLSSASVIALLAISPAFAQTTSPTTMPPSATQGDSQSKATTPSATQDKPATVTLTDDQAKRWVGKAVYSSDGSKIGEVVALQRATDNKVTELHADIGGFLGMGESRVKLMPSDFKLQGDRVLLTITKQQAMASPKVAK